MPGAFNRQYSSQRVRAAIGGEVLELIEFPVRAVLILTGLVERVMTLEARCGLPGSLCRPIWRQMIRGLRDLGYKGTIFTTSAFAAPEIIEQVGKTGRRASS